MKKALCVFHIKTKFYLFLQNEKSIIIKLIYHNAHSSSRKYSGAGKTTLTRLLAKHFNWESHFEDVVDNPYLDDFYHQMERWSFNLQIYFLNRRVQTSFAGFAKAAKHHPRWERFMKMRIFLRESSCDGLDDKPWFYQLQITFWLDAELGWRSGFINLFEKFYSKFSKPDSQKRTRIWKLDFHRLFEPTERKIWSLNWKFICFESCWSLM